MSLSRHISAMWYEGRYPWLSRLLLPLSWIFALLSALRRVYYRLRPAPALELPVVVVGNINAGGSGKTPLLLRLVEELRALGWHPGVVSRGYGGRHAPHPLDVTAASDPHLAGDEPLMLARRGCPVVVAPDRLAAARQLASRDDCDVVLSDDGLQHYRLSRDLEIIVVDAARGLGNRRLLPAGPLREGLWRLRQAHWRVLNGTRQAPLPGRFWAMALEPVAWRRLLDGGRLPLDQGPARAPGPVHALAGIGHPERFFEALADLELPYRPHPFPDHHVFRREDLDFSDRRPVVMTEKDAVKCGRWMRDGQLPAPERFYYLEVTARVDPVLFRELDAALRDAAVR